MKVHTPEIAWHGRDPVYSCDVQPSQGGKSPIRIATCGTDSNIRIWFMNFNSENKATPEFASNLSRHNKAVNCIRWSPDGKILASGADDGCVILWQLSNSQGGGSAFGKDDEEVSKETWSGFKTLRGHLEDVYDLCWSSDGSRLISGSVDNSAIIWDITKGEKMHLLKDHRSFVQGVAWDPRDKMCATISCDRSLRIYNLNTYRCMYNITKMPITSTTNDGETQTKQLRMFHDDTLKSFFRRIAFTPDGEILIAPSGNLEVGDSTMNTTFLFTRNSMPRPVLHLPGPTKATVAVRCCPVLFELRKAETPAEEEPMDTSEPTEKTDPSKEDQEKESTKKMETDEEGKKADEEKPQSLFNLPYRVIFAVATEDSILLYDTQQNIPFAMISNLHYSQLSDISWSSDAKLLLISSTDGYCTMISFEDGELGIPYVQPTKLATTNTSKVIDESSKVTNESSKVESLKPIATDNRTIQEESKIVSEIKNTKTDSVVTKATSPGSSVTNATSPESTVTKATVPSPQPSNQTNNKGPQPRRIQLTTVTSPKPVPTANTTPQPRRVQLTTVTSPTPVPPSNNTPQPRRVTLTTISSTQENK